MALLLQAGERRLAIDVILVEAGAGAALAFLLGKFARAAYPSWLAGRGAEDQFPRDGPIPA